ncbi:hypothetical protein CUC15_04955 [Oceanobacillus zhaokaii]|uniref:Uncharacterized protein n=1 Tax=Oceanobacillus zhaokaii TaxID=2052660 RepID=A0A345PE89_9BACI|nr:hypothetical protein CUC15_04955 [Oceanobacillus zhaokaii]
MKNKTRSIITLVGSFLIFSVGMLRILTESPSSISLFVAYVFAITGFIGVAANIVILRKLQSN